MVTREERDLLQSVLDDLPQRDTYPRTASRDEQDAWMGREEAESALAGLISTVLVGGQVDKQAVDKARALAGLFRDSRWHRQDRGSAQRSRSMELLGRQRAGIP